MPNDEFTIPFEKISHNYYIDEIRSCIYKMLILLTFIVIYPMYASFAPSENTTVDFAWRSIIT